MIAHGKYSDGQILDSQPVTLEFDEAGSLLIRGEQLELTFSLDDIRFSDRLGHVVRFLYLPGEAVVETPDNDIIDQVLLARQRAGGSRLIHFLENHSGIAAFATVALVILTVCAIRFGVPILSREVAYRVPVSLEKQIGRTALSAINQSLPPSQLSARDRQRVQEQLRRLLPNRLPRQLPRLEFRVLGNANAFALPGDIIVVSDELVILATNDDEIAAVLAHELGHLEKRHGLQSLLRSSSALLVVSAVTGDLSSLTSFAGTLPFLLLRSGYSREFEHEADVYAHDLMLERGINLKYFASIMKKLEAQHADQGKGIGYFSTHPATEDRIKLFQTADDATTAEAAPEPEWKTEDAIASTGTLTESAPPVAEKSTEAAPTESETVTPIAEFSQLSQRPRSLSQATPVYPSQMRSSKISGEVIVEFTVNEKGHVTAARAVRSTRKEFDQAAVEAVFKWKFKPGEIDGHAVSTRMQVPIVFSLNENDANRRLLRLNASVHDKAGGSEHTPFTLLSRVEPVYPTLERFHNVEGLALLELTVDTEGQARDIKVLRNTRAAFGEAAIAAVRQWKFKPATKDGQPVSTLVQIPLVFSLNEDAQPTPAEQPPGEDDAPPPPPPQNVRWVRADGSQIKPSDKDYPTLRPFDPHFEGFEGSYADNTLTSVQKLYNDEHIIVVRQERGAYNLKDCDDLPICNLVIRPVYPPSLQRAGIKGSVLVDLLVEPDGSVKLPYVINHPRPEFVQAALDAIKTMTFTPAKKAGRPVEAGLQVRILFNVPAYARARDVGSPSHQSKADWPTSPQGVR